MALNTHWYTEDWTCLAAYGLWMCYISTVLVMAHYGEGYHEWEVTKESYKEVLRWLYIGSILYCPAAYLTKATLLLLEARVFAVYERRKVFISDMCLGVFTDIIILLLPLAMTFSLRLPFWTKVKVVALLSAGGIATGVSIFRLYKSILFLEPSDRTEGFVLLDITTALDKYPVVEGKILEAWRRNPDVSFNFV
ncbi:hypothetical protein CFRS1_v012284 [Colletotrichum fructicola]|nr:hypothetical protein CFRS1_v012284 [Colletotrichum fructicola]